MIHTGHGKHEEDKRPIRKELQPGHTLPGHGHTSPADANPAQSAIERVVVKGTNTFPFEGIKADKDFKVDLLSQSKVSTGDISHETHVPAKRTLGIDAANQTNHDSAKVTQFSQHEATISPGPAQARHEVPAVRPTHAPELNQAKPHQPVETAKSEAHVARTDSTAPARHDVHPGVGEKIQCKDGSVVTCDKQGHVTDIVHPDGKSVHFDRNQAGKIVGYTDESGAKWTSQNGWNWTGPGGIATEGGVWANTKDGSYSVLDAYKGETLVHKADQSKLVVETRTASAGEQGHKAGDVICHTNSSSGKAA